MLPVRNSTVEEACRGWEASSEGSTYGAARQSERGRKGHGGAQGAGTRICRIAWTCVCIFRCLLRDKEHECGQSRCRGGGARDTEALRHRGGQMDVPRDRRSPSHIIGLVSSSVPRSLLPFSPSFVSASKSIRWTTDLPPKRTIQSTKTGSIPRGGWSSDGQLKRRGAGAGEASVTAVRGIANTRATAAGRHVTDGQVRPTRARHVTHTTSAHLGGGATDDEHAPSTNEERAPNLPLHKSKTAGRVLAVFPFTPKPISESSRIPHTDPPLSRFLRNIFRYVACAM